MEQNETKKTVDTEKENRTRYFHCALQLARMYGVAETLHPLPYLPMEKFVSLMEAWAAEQETRQETPILAFFEEKMAQKSGRKNLFKALSPTYPISSGDTYSKMSDTGQSRISHSVFSVVVVIGF